MTRTASASASVPSASSTVKIRSLTVFPEGESKAKCTPQINYRKCNNLQTPKKWLFRNSNKINHIPTLPKNRGGYTPLPPSQNIPKSTVFNKTDSRGGPSVPRRQ